MARRSRRRQGHPARRKPTAAQAARRDPRPSAQSAPADTTAATLAAPERARRPAVEASPVGLTLPGVEAPLRPIGSSDAAPRAALASLRDEQPQTRRMVVFGAVLLVLGVISAISWSPVMLGVAALVVALRPESRDRPPLRSRGAAAAVLLAGAFAGQRALGVIPTDVTTDQAAWAMITFAAFALGLWLCGDVLRRHSPLAVSDRLRVAELSLGVACSALAWLTVALSVTVVVQVLPEL